MLDSGDRVSVILPYYNRSRTLLASVMSVLRQSHQDLVLYLIDDGSTDDSRNRASMLDDSRIRHVYLEDNQGLVAARNVGLERADTSLIAFMDSDDVWGDVKLERQIEFLRTSQAEIGEISVVGCGWRYLGDSTPSKAFRPGPFSRLDVLANQVAGMGSPTLLVDRAVANAEARFDSAFPSLEDGDFVMTCLENGSMIAVVPEVLMEVRRGTGQNMGSSARTAPAWEAYLHKYETDLCRMPTVRSWYAFRAMRDHLKNRNVSAALPHLRSTLRYDSARRLVHATLGILGGRIGIAVADRLVNATPAPPVNSHFV